jgi:site-specific DNA recombinase
MSCFACTCDRLKVASAGSTVGVTAHYVSTPLITGTRSDDAKGRRIPAGDIEGLILDRLRAFFASERDIGEALSCFDLDASALRAALSKASHLAETWSTQPSIVLRELVRAVVEKINVQDDKVIASLKRRTVAIFLLGEGCNVSTDCSSQEIRGLGWAGIPL